MNKQAKEDYQNLWNEFVEVLPTLVKSGAIGSAKGYTRKLHKLFEGIFETDEITDEESMMPDDDKVNNPTHYQSIDVEVDVDAITCMRAAFGKGDVKAFCLCNAMKYIFRSSFKGKNIDIEKAVWYLNKFLELGGYE